MAPKHPASSKPSDSSEPMHQRKILNNKEKVKLLDTLREGTCYAFIMSTEREIYVRLYYILLLSLALLLLKTVYMCSEHEGYFKAETMFFFFYVFIWSLCIANLHLSRVGLEHNSCDSWGITVPLNSYDFHERGIAQKI